jgi:hypothetical protein
MKEENCEMLTQQFEMTCEIGFRICKAQAEKVVQKLLKVDGLTLEESIV